MAQVQINEYPFIHSALNRLSFSNDSSAFKTFAGKLSSLKSGQLNRLSIVHIGGSHVQGGTWSNTFATSFQTYFGTKGGGYFVFPYKIAKTNGQPFAASFTNGKWKRCRGLGKDYCQPLGLCAMNVSTNDSFNYFGVRLTTYAACSNANEVRVYHNFNPSFGFMLSDSSLQHQRTDDAEAGYSSFRFARPLDSVSFVLTKRDTLRKDFVLYGLSLQNDLLPGFYLAGLGANGASSATFLRCTHMVPQLKSLQPDLVILSLGVNDTQSKGFEKDDYIEHYDSLIARIKLANPAALILLTTTTDNFIRRKTSNKRTISAREAMFELMQKHQVAVWDLFSIMGGYKSMVKWNKAGLAARDKVHFTTKGYAIVGSMMFEAFMTAYTNSLKQ